MSKYTDALLIYLSYLTKLSDCLRYSPADYLIYHGTNPYNRNWGDELNRYLLPLLSGKKVFMSPPIKEGKGEFYKYIEHIHLKPFNQMKNATIYSAIGSVLGWLHHENSVVWGSGFIHENNKLPVEPKEIMAVRGPCTADIIKDQLGISVDVFGDPAVLYSQYYWPKIQKTHNLGIIPHYLDYQKVKKQYHGVADVKIIDIMSGNQKVVDDILSCKNIASSSLHGLIMADAYNIPTTWIDCITSKINDFKYYDYYESIRCDKNLISLKDYDKTTDIIASVTMPAHKINMRKLLSVCPFYCKETSPIQIL